MRFKRYGMDITWDETKELATARAEWRQRVA